MKQLGMKERIHWVYFWSSQFSETLPQDDSEFGTEITLCHVRNSNI